MVEEANIEVQALEIMHTIRKQRGDFVVVQTCHDRNKFGRFRSNTARFTMAFLRTPELVAGVYNEDTNIDDLIADMKELAGP